MSDTIDTGYDPLSAAAIADPERYWRHLRAQARVHHFVLPQSEVERMGANPFAAQPTTEFWTVLRHADVAKVLTSPREFPSSQGPGVDRMTQAPDGGVLIFADGAVHRRQRRLVAKAFTPRAVTQLLPRIQETVDDLLDGHLGRGRMELVSAIGFPLSIRTVLQIMGVPLEHADDFQRWGGAITGALGGDPDAIRAGGVALVTMFGYLRTLIDAIRTGDTGSAELADGVLAGLVRVEDEGNRLTDEEICQITMQLITAGYETTSTALANGVHALCEHPEQRARFERADQLGMRTAVEEILRFVGPQAGLFRSTSCDMELGGCPIPSNAKVRAAFASANRDEAAFRNADTFDIERSPAELRAHLAFGLGPHACIGAALARAELAAAFQTLFRRLPGLELDPDNPPKRNVNKLTLTGFDRLHIRWDPSRVRPSDQPRQDHPGRDAL